MNGLISKLLPRIIPLGIILSLMLHVYYSNQLVLLAQQVENIEKSRLKLIIENSEMEYLLAARSSLKVIDERAKSLGFIKTSNIIVLDASDYRIALQSKR